ncbi:alpha/beta hydrolase [Glycomyces salinus]|uniref:alpha/beta hydrolase n=1 Tax=Glycomyces salinus TaxID=980294 RepID=UPI0018EDF153|nr:alpha/beta fold hydrolase [Glycomyces salinus]
MPWAWIVRVALVVVLAWVLVLVAAWLGQRALIYHPDISDPEPPADAEEAALRTGDGLELTAWRFPPTGADREAAVMVLPGNAGNRGGRAELGRSLAGAGFTALLVDYRGYGGNPGSPTEDGLHQDALAAWDLLREDFEADRIILFGESLGSGVAARLDAETGPAGLVFRSPFTSLAAAGSEHYPLLPVDLLLRDRYPVVEHLERGSGPVVVVYAADDEVVSAEQSLEVAAAAEEAGRRVTAVEVEAEGHNDFVLGAGPDVIGAVEALADGLDLTA